MSPLRVAFENYVPRAGFFDSDLGLVRAGLAVKENQLCSNQSEGPRNLFRGAQAASLQVSAACRDSLQRLKIDAPVIECCRQLRASSPRSPDSPATSSKIPESSMRSFRISLEIMIHDFR